MATPLPRSSTSSVVLAALTGYAIPYAPAVALLVAVGGGLSVGGALGLGVDSPSEAAALAAILVLASAADLARRVVPNRLIVLGVVLALVAGVAAGDLSYRLTGAIAAGAALLGARFVGQVGWGQPGMGMGDVKLGILLGLFLGWGVLWALYLAVLLGGAVGVVTFATGRFGRGSTLPFAPMLSAGVVLAGSALSFDRFIAWLYL